jgi:carboxyl-terminal processing protease
VLAPIEGAPAFRAGIKSGDRIVAVDGEDAQGIGLGRMVEHMRGAPGTHVKLTTLRPGREDLLTYDLIREIVHVPSVASRRLAGDIAYVRVKQFQEGTHDELVAAAAKVRGEGPSKNPIAGVVLDMRGNPGGLVDEASAVADEFLDSGTLYTMRHRGQVIEEERAHSGGAFAAVPVVILVSEYSASAAELVAGALQDNRRALVVGENSYGKGSVQSLLELPGGAGLRLTTARYYTPSGHAIQADGIHPDLYIPSPERPNTLPVQRERDLEGHLAAENAQPPNAAQPSLSDHSQIVVSPPPPSSSQKDAGAAAQSGDAGKPPHASVEGSFADEIPVDPSVATNEDAQLKAAYKLMRDQLVGRGPIVK